MRLNLIFRMLKVLEPGAKVGVLSSWAPSGSER